MNVFIFHGTGGNPQENWFPWLERELKKLGIEVFVPRFPTPEGQSLENWIKAFEPYQKFVNETSVFVGHSIGPAMILRLLELRNKPIGGGILVSAFDGIIGIEYFDNLNKTFVVPSFNWEKIKRNCRKFVMLSGDNDPYVPLKFPRRIAKKLGVLLQLVKKGGHLNATAGFTKFPEVLAEIKKLVD